MSILPIEYGIRQKRNPLADSLRALRQPSLKPYQEAFIRELLAHEHDASA